jgi:hypothetical protein
MMGFMLREILGGAAPVIRIECPVGKKIVRDEG